MFCPKCGREQSVESLRFCSRCGFKLSTGAEGLTLALIKVALYLVLTVCAIFGWGSITAGPAFMQVRVIILLVAAITFYLLFAHDLKRVFGKSFSRNDQQMKDGMSDDHGALPAGPLAALGAHRVNTAEIVQPPSVTEHTTIVLDKNKH